MCEEADYSPEIAGMAAPSAGFSLPLTALSLSRRVRLHVLTDSSAEVVTVRPKAWSPRRRSVLGFRFCPPGPVSGRRDIRRARFPGLRGWISDDGISEQIGEIATDIHDMFYALHRPSCRFSG